MSESNQISSNHSANGVNLYGMDSSGYGALDVASLTPDALLTYCATQLQSIDATIKEFMQAQKTMLARKEILQQLKNDIAGNNTVNKSPEVEDANKKNVAEAYKAAYDKLVEKYPELAAEINKQFREWFPNGDLSTGDLNTKDNKAPTASDSEFQEKVGHVQNMIDDLGANMELNMIRLQAEISKRGTVIQLTTSMLDKLGKSLDQIAANYK
jgi:hypothetical protein